MIRPGFAISALMLGAALAVADTVPSYCTTRRISTSSSGAQANGPSRLPSISPDGAWVAFESSASDLVAGDTNGASDVFLKEVATGALWLVSRTPGGVPANGRSDHATVSANGEWVLFESDASDLVPADTNGVRDVFLFERATGAVTRVSVTASGAQADGPSGSSGAFHGSHLAADGQRVVFASRATNLVPGDQGGFSDVFLLDRAGGTLTCITVNAQGQFADGDSFQPVLSGDGTVVAFATDATNLAGPDTNGVRDVLLVAVGGTGFHVASRSSAGIAGNGDSARPQLNTTGSFVAFESLATNLVPGDTNGAQDVFLHTVPSGLTERVSVAHNGAQADASSRLGSFSGPNPTIPFSSAASTLLINGNGAEAVYTRTVSWIVPSTALWSVDSALSQGLGGSREPSFAGNLARLVFTSDAALVPGDTNGVSDVYLRDCGWPVTAICTGSPSACPCGNFGGSGAGCGNSSGAGATLNGWGVPSVFVDSLTLQASGLPAGSLVIFFEGTTTLNGGAGVPFGDGLRCIAAGVRRLATRQASAQGIASLGAAQPGDPLLSVLGAIPAAGGVRRYQAWYSDPASSCTAASFNLTNGASIDWAP